MRVPSTLASSFGEPFEKLISEFATEKGLLPNSEAIKSPRYLSRSIVPHIKKLSLLFNRIDPDTKRPKELDQVKGLAPYWKESSNPEHLRLAYFLYFMPCNLFRIAAIWSELGRLGFKWSAGEVLRAIEFGAGPASGATGFAAAESCLPSSFQTGLPRTGNWALIEQDKAILELGEAWAERFFASQGFDEWGIRPFHRKLDLATGLLPKSAPSFNLWVMSFFLNELSPEDTDSAGQLAKTLLRAWERHLEEEGIVIIAEPALKLQSRRLLKLRQALLNEKAREKIEWLQILLPCLGHQACGALANPEDWCHEEVTWWRPPYFRQLDKMAELDRKTLPFSYLVLTKSRRSRDAILPGLRAGTENSRLRLVSPAHAEGKDQEFFVCGAEGKRRARFRPRELAREEDGAERLERGDILLSPEFRGDVHSTRIISTGGLAGIPDMK